MSDEPGTEVAVAQTETSLEELFDKDPLDLTQDDIEKVVTTLRAQRAKFNLAEGAKLNAPKKPKKETGPKVLGADDTKKKLEKPKPEQDKLNLGDLGLI